MARPKSATHELKRDAILDTAALCFGQKSSPAASMNDLGIACGASKARLYHYYDSKEAILFDLLDRYTLRLLASLPRPKPRRSGAIWTNARPFMNWYAASCRNTKRPPRHVALLNDTKFLGESQRELILDRQRDVVSAVTRFLRRAYPSRLNPANQTAVTMMLFGMINGTFTWLPPGGAMSYAAFSDEVVAMLETGLAG